MLPYIVKCLGKAPGFERCYTNLEIDAAFCSLQFEHLSSIVLMIEP